MRTYIALSLSLSLHVYIYIYIYRYTYYHYITIIFACYHCIHVILSSLLYINMDYIYIYIYGKKRPPRRAGAVLSCCLQLVSCRQLYYITVIIYIYIYTTT